ncbi:MAG: PIN domain-containing protein [Actinomycetota bacterium]
MEGPARHGGCARLGSRDPSPERAPVLFDSDVLIWILRGSERARAFFESVPASNRMLPAIVEMETVHGARDRSDLRLIRRFLDGAFAGTIHISEEISRRAAALVERYALSHRITPHDALIAATGLTMRAPLATGNARD